MKSNGLIFRMNKNLLLILTNVVTESSIAVAIIINNLWIPYGLIAIIDRDRRLKQITQADRLVLISCYHEKTE